MRLFSYTKILHFHFKLLKAITPKPVDQRRFWETKSHSTSLFASFSNQRLSCSKVPHRALFIQINRFCSLQLYYIASNERYVADKRRQCSHPNWNTSPAFLRKEWGKPRTSQDIPLLGRGSISMPPENEGLLSTRPPFCAVSRMLSQAGKNKIITFLVKWCIKTQWKSRSVGKWELNCIHCISYNLLQMIENDKSLLKVVIHTSKNNSRTPFIRMLVIRIANNSDRLGPSGKHFLNATILHLLWPKYSPIWQVEARNYVNVLFVSK